MHHQDVNEEMPLLPQIVLNSSSLSQISRP